ncbi:FAD-binding and (Fe-S)-binding domain-containing protein [Thalassotalea ponticola]|uniref:D-2-hydroxyglutarate dehydrogenase YdiJ n=1 Tax=Thalassotalea ponticola TaxID=1523392 RepID=UPI0025B432CB|nr:FAD-binding and (Fe-S)-binding domain-containing protein [Thalassotalea ponticola]MDN3651429.1 FAD-binding and (Fe-S)-binding domain-containing protein [Thalassotalea ponticola]
MLPRLAITETISPLYQAYVKALKKAGFTGDVEISYASRLAVATDNSVYQQLPQAVMHPRTVEDVKLINRVASEARFNEIKFSARGGGTGTNGQSLTPGIVVDMSRHMKQIIEVNTNEHWVKVQAGVVKDQLNEFLKPLGFFFSPDLSTSNRATIGGMINTDASGQGSLVYGKTSEHVLALRCVLANGNELHTQAKTKQQVEDIIAKGDNEAQLYETAYSSCLQNRDQIVATFPRLNRFLTGYDLEHVFNDDLSRFDLGRLITGSEGTLAMVTEATLNITPIPSVRALVNIKYDSFESALRHAPALVKANALSVETVDSRVLNLAKSDIIWHSVADLITDVANQHMDGLNLVEFAGDSEAEIEQAIASLEQSLNNSISEQQHGVIGYQLTYDLASINRLYAMRKKAVGLLGNSKDQAKPIAFAEDTAVPPENLADFILEFRQLLDGYQLDYGMFGHVDAGVLHVRPALDMCDPKQEQIMREISDQVVALTSKYGGLMWGEHGKGYRSEYGIDFFGETLFTELRRIKAAFDPLNKMNPGKICTPLASNESLVSVDGVKRGYFDRQIPIAVRETLPSVTNCNGNGLCFNFDPKSPMCPSSKITSDRRHSPKGRAGLMREWLRLLSEQNVDFNDLSKQDQGFSVKSLALKTVHTLQGKLLTDDFSHEVMDAMSGCLACKACASQCPVKVDVPEFKAQFTQVYYSRYLRPMKDHVVANIERIAPKLANIPRVANLAIDNRLFALFSKQVLGYVDTPLLSVPTLSQQLQRETYKRFDLSQLAALSEREREGIVVVVQDPFTSFYDANVVSDFMALIKRLGFSPVLLPFMPNGKPQHVKGFLQKFASTAKDSAALLSQLADLNITMVGCDASMVLCYRDEYKQVLADQETQFSVLLAHEWLSLMIDSPQRQFKVKAQPSDTTYQLFSHCTEKTALPSSEQQWQTIFKYFGLKLMSVSVGCCGMAGTYGHEKSHYQRSKGLYQLSWQQPIEAGVEQYQLATGFSCRSQVKRFGQKRLRHPLQALLTHLEP